MTIDWNKKTFKSLAEIWHKSEGQVEMSDEELAMKGRFEEIMCLVESDRISPSSASLERGKFISGLREVLSRLTEDTFSKVQSEIGYILEEPTFGAYAINVPAPREALPPRCGGGVNRVALDTIVFFRASLGFELTALIGLIAHEIAHSFVDGKDYQSDEDLADMKVREWGFGHELDVFRKALEALNIKGEL